MNQASVGFHCPECARSGRQRVYNARSLMQVTPYATLAIIAVNAAVFLADIAAGTQLTVWPTGGTKLSDVAGNGLLWGPAVAAGDWWRPITGGFIHYGLIHIAFNMVILYQLGRLLEPAIGRVRFLLLYFMALLGGSFLVLVISPDTQTAGASGAVFGLMGAAVIAFRSRGISPFETGLGQLLVINLIFTFAAAGTISVGGHIGGLVAGFIGGWLLFELAPKIPSGKYVAPLLVAALGVGLFVGCLVIANNPIN
jgi:membrane associated rhomboid family serine protease